MSNCAGTDVMTAELYKDVEPPPHIKYTDSITCSNLTDYSQTQQQAQCGPGITARINDSQYLKCAIPLCSYCYLFYSSLFYPLYLYMCIFLLTFCNFCRCWAAGNRISWRNAAEGSIKFHLIRSDQI